MAREVNASTPDYGPGTYQDPKSGKYLTVNMNAAADALVRMGWERVSDADAVMQTSDVQDPGAESEATATPEPHESIDDSVA